MKSTTTLLPIFLLLLSTFIVSHLPSATAADVAVLDEDGDRMRNGGSYYMLSVFREQGGVDLAATGNETCRLTIVQTKSEGDEGKPVIISSPLPTAIMNDITIINEESSLYLSFAPVPKCAPRPSQWTVVNGIPDVPSALKITGYNNIAGGSFVIHKSSYTGYYKLIFCPSPTKQACSDVGVRHDVNGQNILALGGNDTPFIVAFRKARFSSGWIEKA